MITVLRVVIPQSIGVKIITPIAHSLSPELQTLSHSLTLSNHKMTEQHYSFRGIFTDKNYSTRLGYVAETAQDAWNKCAELNPTFLVQNWGLAGSVD